MEFFQGVGFAVIVGVCALVFASICVALSEFYLNKKIVMSTKIAFTQLLLVGAGVIAFIVFGCLFLSAFNKFHVNIEIPPTVIHLENVVIKGAGFEQSGRETTIRSNNHLGYGEIDRPWVTGNWNTQDGIDR